eukprot:SAG11_NODE_3531_length_2388_cov_37.576234_3_plen_310_part_00
MIYTTSVFSCSAFLRVSLCFIVSCRAQLFCARVLQKRGAVAVGPPEVQPPPKKKKKPSVKKKARIEELERLLAAEKKQSSDLANQVSQLTEEVGIIRRQCADEHKKEMKEQQMKHEELVKVQKETDELMIARLTKELSMKNRDVEEASSKIDTMKKTFKEMFQKAARDIGYNFIDDTSAAASPQKTARELRIEAREKNDGSQEVVDQVPIWSKEDIIKIAQADLPDLPEGKTYPPMFKRFLECVSNSVQDGSPSGNHSCCCLLFCVCSNLVLISQRPMLVTQRFVVLCPSFTCHLAPTVSTSTLWSTST